MKCITQPDIEVPADADFIIEGYVDPTEELIWEGPFGDHTGYYSLPDWYPRFHITAITHRKNAVYPATIVGIPPQEDAWLGKATERIFLAPIKMTLVPEIVDMDMPVEGVFHNLVIAQIRKEYAGQGQKVMNAMWGAGQMMFNKILVIADELTSIHGLRELAATVFRHLIPATDVYFSQGPDGCAGPQLQQAWVWRKDVHRRDEQDGRRNGCRTIPTERTDRRRSHGNGDHGPVARDRGRQPVPVGTTRSPV